MWHNPALWTMTSDGHVPYKTFFLMQNAIENIEAVDELAIVRAVALGYALAKAPDDNAKSFKIKKLHRELIKLAYPEVPDLPVAE